MEVDFFTYTHQLVAKDNAAGSFEVAHSREAALSRLQKFLSKDDMPFSGMSPCLILQFEKWLMAEGLKESTVRFYLNQLNAIYNQAVKDGIVPKVRLLKGVKTAIPVKTNRELLSEDELRRMRYADLSGSKALTLARDMFFFSIYGRGISFSDIANIKKSYVRGFKLTYTSQTVSLPQITVQWEVAMQEIADRYPSDTDYLFPFIKSEDKEEANREMNRVRENIMKSFKRIATRCNLSVVPSMYMTKDIYQRAIDSVSVSKII